MLYGCISMGDAALPDDDVVSRRGYELADYVGEG